jgi:hypothetical protein
VKQLSGILFCLRTVLPTAIVLQQEECPNRIVKDTWPGSTATILAKDRNRVRGQHIEEMGVTTFTSAGEYTYEVSSHTKLLLVQLWGAGGGSGNLVRQKGGHGGAGTFVECLLHVRSGEKLYVVVGSGGQGGVHGKLVKDEEAEVLQMIDEYGEAAGGAPGGGSGFGGNKSWAAGGGGGFSSLTRRGPMGKELVLVAAGGGGGGSRDGVPGGDFFGAPTATKQEQMNGILRGTERDPINGGQVRDRIADVISSRWWLRTVDALCLFRLLSGSHFLFCCTTIRERKKKAALQVSALVGCALRMKGIKSS